MSGGRYVAVVRLHGEIVKAMRTRTRKRAKAFIAQTIAKHAPSVRPHLVGTIGRFRRNDKRVGGWHDVSAWGYAAHYGLTVRWTSLPAIARAIERNCTGLASPTTKPEKE